MFKALICIFNYEGKEWLPGTEEDLRNITNFCQQRKVKPYIITEQNVKTKEELDQHLISYFSDLSIPRLFLYFSGHGMEDGILLPGGEIYSFYHIKSYLISLPINTEVFWLNDCCHLSSLRLPYRLEPKGNYIEELKADLCPCQPLILLTSTSEGEKSLTSTQGSLFTLLFLQYNYIVDLNDLLSTLRENINILLKGEPYSQVPIIYSSTNTIKTLWPWLQEIECINYKNYIPFKRCLLAELPPYVLKT